jgi:hypothetical protein
MLKGVGFHPRSDKKQRKKERNFDDPILRPVVIVISNNNKRSGEFLGATSIMTDESGDASKFESSKVESGRASNEKVKGRFTSGVWPSFFSFSEKPAAVGSDNASELEGPREINNYDVNALRVPSMVDAATQEHNNNNDDDDDDEEILNDPYDEINPRKERFEEEDDSSSLKDTRLCLIRFGSKIFFVLGSILFLIVAIKEYQRVEQAGLQSTGDIQNSAGEAAGDDDVDPFIGSNSHSFNVTALEGGAELSGSNKDERTGGALRRLIGGSKRRRLQTNWYTEYWSDVPEDVRASAGLLGYDENKWDNEEEVFTDRMFWDELSTEQQNAAYDVFGYSKETWNDYVERHISGNQQTIAEVTPLPATDVPTVAPVPVPAPVPAPETGTTDAPTIVETDTSAVLDENNVIDDEGEGSGTNFVSAYNVEINGDFPPEPRGKTFQALFISASICFLLVGILDGIHQQLGFHAVMVMAGIIGAIAGAFSTSNAQAYNVCYSISSHLFLLQSVLVIHSRLLLTYDNVVRRVLSFADGMFFVGAVMNVVVSYMQYNDTTSALATTTMVAAALWVLAAIIFLGVAALFLFRLDGERRGGTKSGDASVAESCKVQANGEGDCEISLSDGQLFSQYQKNAF